jgi:stress response protein SCP2
MSDLITLTKDMGSIGLEGATHVAIGLAWDTSTGGSGRLMGALKQARGTDLDAIAVLMQGDQPVIYVGLDNTDPADGAVTSTGDEHTGKTSGDDETINVDFAKVPAEITEVLFTVAAFKKGTDFSKAKNVVATVYVSTTGKGGLEKKAVIRPSLLGNGNMIIAAKAVRQGGEWALEIVNTHKKFKQGDFQAMLRCVIGG